MTTFFSCNMFVSASESNNATTAFTQELAGEIGLKVAETVTNSDNITVNKTIGFYDTAGEPSGYIVHFKQDNIPFGYVILDTSMEDLVSEFSFGSFVQSPYETVVSNYPSTYSSDEEALTVYKMSPIEYGVSNDEGVLTTNSGEIVNSTSVSNYSRGKDPTTWEEPLLDITEVYENYTLVNTDHLDEFISFNDSMIKQETDHYACAVSALLACAAYYNAVDYSDIAGDYMDLWDMSNTSIDPDDSNSRITYGSTQDADIGPALVAFCDSKNISVSQLTSYSAPYSFFTNTIDRDDIAITMCAIYDANKDERSGHAMAVEGYATLRKTNSGATVRTLMVFDGWGDSVRYLNYDFGSYYEPIDGVSFSG